MKDLGLNPFRKSSVFEEWFVRYKPSDYRTILDEYRNMRRHQLEVESTDGHAAGLNGAVKKLDGYAAGAN